MFVFYAAGYTRPVLGLVSGRRALALVQGPEPLGVAMSPALLLVVVGFQVVSDRVDKTVAGQLCPISSERAWTAAHVVDGTAGLTWEGPFGASGRLQVLTLDKERDIAMVTAQDKPFPSWYSIGKKPETGEAVHILGVGYYVSNWYRLDGIVLGMRKDGGVAYTQAGHPGVSGGCLLNEKGETLGIVLGTLSPAQEQDKHVAPVGYAWPLWKK